MEGALSGLVCILFAGLMNWVAVGSLAKRQLKWESRPVVMNHRAAPTRGTFHSVKELISAIQDYISGHNQNPRVFVRSASVGRILTKVAKSKEALDALHKELRDELTLVHRFR
jgi:hypothetical protein